MFVGCSECKKHDISRIDFNNMRHCETCRGTMNTIVFGNKNTKYCFVINGELVDPFHTGKRSEQEAPGQSKAPAINIKNYINRLDSPDRMFQWCFDSLSYF